MQCGQALLHHQPARTHIPAPLLGVARRVNKLSKRLLKRIRS